MDFSAGLVVQGGGRTRLSVRRMLPDGRAAALELEVASPGGLWSRARGTFVGLHVEDPAGIDCPFLGSRRCDARSERGWGSVLSAEEIYRRHGNPTGGAEQPEFLWHAMAGLLHAWTADLPSRDVRGATPAVGTLDSAPVGSVADLLTKYGSRGIRLLVERCVGLLPPAAEGDDLSARLGVAAVDLEAALGHAAGRRRRPSEAAAYWPAPASGAAQGLPIEVARVDDDPGRDASDPVFDEIRRSHPDVQIEETPDRIRVRSVEGPSLSIARGGRRVSAEEVGTAVELLRVVDEIERESPGVWIDTDGVPGQIRVFTSMDEDGPSMSVLFEDRLPSADALRLAAATLGRLRAQFSQPAPAIAESGQPQAASGSP